MLGEFTLDEVQKAYPNLTKEQVESVQRWLNKQRQWIEKERIQGRYVTHPQYYRTVAKIRGT